MKGADAMADTYKMLMLKDWDSICERVKKGLERLGHDILIVQEYDTTDRKERKVQK